jgi:hypothetical protein
LDGIGTLKNANLDEMSNGNVNAVSRQFLLNDDAIQPIWIWMELVRWKMPIWMK